MKIFEANGHKYSRKQFEEYKFRAKVELKTKEEVAQDIINKVIQFYDA